MSVSKDRAGVPTRRHARVIKVAPVTRAIRAALAVSATTLALTASGGLFAGNCAAPNTTAIHCNGSFYQSEIHPAMDLTLVRDGELPRNVVPAMDGGASRSNVITVSSDAAATEAQSFGDVQDLMVVSALTPGPGGVPGSDNTVYLGASGVTSRSSDTGTFTSTPSTTGYADFVFAASDHFAGFINNASISATGYTWAAGFELEADAYASDVRNSATGAMDIRATGDFGQAWGIYTVAGSDAAIYNDGSIDVSASGYAGTATGLFDYSIAGNASADNTGTIAADASGDYGQARGVYAAAYGNATATNSNIIIATAYGYGGTATSLSAYSLHGDASGDNSGTLSAISYGDATGMRGYAAAGNVGLTNSGDIVAYSQVGNAIGIYGYALAGDVTIDNSGTIGAYSYYGLADGIFASGNAVGVTNSGPITTYGSTWSAGIEAQGNNSATVDNSGVISVATYNGPAYGIYATGGTGGVAIGNSGAISAFGLFSTGIEATASGDISIDNTGDINVGQMYYTVQAIGIRASNNYAGSTIEVTNGGDITANGYYGATGIDVAALGTGGTASVGNSADIYASQANKYGYGAIGIFASADGNSSITNTGSITTDSGGASYGAMALSFNGTANVTNAGDINVSTSAMLYYSGVGILAASSNGAASADNSGNITVDASKYVGTGIQVSGNTGATATNSGSIDVGAKYAYGIAATANQGDASITNAAGGSINVYSAAPNGFAAGTVAISTVGDVSVVNGGGIDAEAYGNAFGVFASTGGGTTSVDNSGSIYAYSYAGRATGVLGQAVGGDTVVGNTGDVAAVSYYGNAVAIDASSSGGNADVTSGGSAYAASYYGTAIGISAFSVDADASVDNGGNVTALSGYGNAVGIYAYAANGTATATSSGDIVARAGYGLADGIFASGLVIDVGNTGSIDAEGYSWAAGIEAQGVDSASVTNGGDITSISAGNAYGVYTTGGAAGVTVDNSGSIYAVGYYATGLLANAAGSISISNTGDITAGNASYTALATGIRATSNNADSDIVVTNGGAVQAYGYFGGTGIDVAALGSGSSGSVANSGDIYASQASFYGYGATGIVVSADVDAGIDNSGSITTVSAGSSYGAVALAFNGEASVDNTGSIGVTSYANQGYEAIGIVANSSNAGATVDNAGTIDVVSSYVGMGVLASGTTGATVTNGGSISVDAAFAYGVYANSGAGDVSVASGGSIDVNAYFGIGTLGLSTYGDIAIDNGGSIASTAYSQSVGVFGRSAYGNVATTNAGAIIAYSYAGPAVGTFARADAGSASIGNDGQVQAQSPFGDAVGVRAIGLTAGVSNGASGIIEATSGYGSATGVDVYAADAASVSNGGAIGATSTYDRAHGVYVIAGGDISVDNLYGASVQASALNGYAIGVLGYSLAGNTVVDNVGGVDATGSAGALGIYAGAYGNVGITSSGIVDVQSGAGSAVGINGYSNAGNVAIDNSGAITIAGGRNSYGAMALSYYGDSTVSNSGDITVAATNDKYGHAVGVMAVGNGASVDNSGNIHAQGYSAAGVSVYGYAGAQVDNIGTIGAQSTAGGDAIGVLAQAYGNLLVYNTGTISATDDDYAVAVSVDSTHTATVVNVGTLRTYSTTEGEIAVRGGNGVQRVFNYGDIYGAIVTGGGDDTLTNGSGGTWHVANHSTDFGDGDDSITNGAGGTIVLADGAIHLGTSGSEGNAFTNNGRIQVQGEALIDMGGGAQTGLLPSANALPLVSNGLIDFVDGAPDDILTVGGDLAGNGALDIDVSPLNTGADLLYVQGNVVDGGVQTVNVSFADFPTSAHIDPIPFAHVAGDSTAGSFVAGHVLGFGANDFLDMQVFVTSQLDPTNATDDIFSVGADVAGLNDPGTLAASIASGAQSLLTSQIGTWRQRMGVLPERNRDDIGVSPWIRVFSDKGEVDPSHAADNFGNAGNFDYDQSNTGREIGMNINVRGGFNAGLLLAKSDGSQHLVGAGAGSDHIKGSAFGLYTTWIGDNGFYVDASYRWFDFTADLTSVAGRQSTDGQGGAFNVEAGFTAWKLAGIDVVPQLQYTRSAIGNIRPVHGEQADFVANGGTSSRGRVGVAFSKAIDNSGWTLTPYGSVNAVREFDGRTDYTIADTFSGSTSTDGTSAMVELGIGAQKKGFSATAGANWTDGGALQSFVGGQLVLRYTW